MPNNDVHQQAVQFVRYLNCAYTTYGGDSEIGLREFCQQNRNNLTKQQVEFMETAPKRFDE